MKRILLVFGLIFLLFGCGVSAILWQFAYRSGPLADGVDHVVPRGSTEFVAQDLAAAGIIPQSPLFALQFRILATVTRSAGTLHAAELHFPAHARVMDVLDILRHAVPVSHRLTVPEGRTARQISALLYDSPYLDGPVPAFAEGSVLPQTLSYTRHTTRADIIGRLQTLMTQNLAKTWAKRDPGLGLSSPQELLILASIVERETGAPAERPLVARVFLNRLAKGMKLQSDPTAIYDLSAGWGTVDHPLTHDEVHRAGLHNTYEIAALPPAPICSPGLAALEAVAHPAAGEMLYFVADGHGGHVFSQTLTEHNRRIDTLRALHTQQNQNAQQKITAVNPLHASGTDLKKATGARP